MSERLKTRGALLVPERLKVDLEPDVEDVRRCQNFAGLYGDMVDELKVK